MQNTTEYYQDELGLQGEKNSKGPRPKKERLGEKQMSCCGQMMTITAYRNVNDIDVTFEDGTKREHCYYCAFKKGEISHPGIPCGSPNSMDKRAKRPDRTGEERAMRCGLKARIIAYHNAKNIDVEFENHEIVNKRTYCDFENGAIRPKGFKKEK